MSSSRDSSTRTESSNTNCLNATELQEFNVRAVHTNMTYFLLAALCTIFGLHLVHVAVEAGRMNAQGLGTPQNDNLDYTFVAEQGHEIANITFQAMHANGRETGGSFLGPYFRRLSYRFKRFLFAFWSDDDDLEEQFLLADSPCGRDRVEIKVRKEANVMALFATAAYEPSEEAFKNFLRANGIFVKLKVIHANWDSEPGRPAYVVFESSSMGRMVAIRGTKDFNDVMTDAHLLAKSLHHGDADTEDPDRVSDGMLTAAQRIIKEAWDHIKGHGKITLVGHSLGAGTAAAMAVELKEKYKERDVKGFIFATPACFSPHLARSSETYITNVILGHDVIPRLAHHAMMKAKLEHHSLITPGKILHIVPTGRGKATMTMVHAQYKHFTRVWNPLGGVLLGYMDHKSQSYIDALRKTLASASDSEI